MKHVIIGAAVALAGPVSAILLDGAMFAAPAQADVKTGVDAWTQGDYVKAVNEWRPLANSGDADAQFNMGQAYKLGRGVPTDLPIAMEWFRKAAEKGHLRAEDNYGLLLFQQNRREEALPFLRRSADRGEARAQYILGTAMFNGELVKKDWVEAYALMTRAAASGLAPAVASLTQMNNYIPADQRKQGLARADALAKKNAMTLAAATEDGNRPGPAPKVAPARPAPTPVKTAAVPPSKPSPTPSPASEKPVVAIAARQPAPTKPQAKPTTKPTVAAPSAKADAPSPALAATGGWRVQLGAFSEEARASALWASLSKKVDGLSAYRPFYVKGGAVTRLQVGPLGSAADAEKLCRSIKAAGTDCIPKKG